MANMRLLSAREHQPGDMEMCAIVAHELYYGAYKSQRAAGNVALIDHVQFEVLDFDKEDARRAGEVRAVLAARGKPIGPYDVMIVGQALARGLILVTHNAGEFERVDGLRWEDWEKE